MSFPMDEFDTLQAEARAIIEDRCKKGRNATMSFYDRYLHGHQDKVQEVWERALRIAGADKVNDLTTMRSDAIDLANEALLLVLLLDRPNKDSAGQNPAPSHPQSQILTNWREVMNKSARLDPYYYSTGLHPRDQTEDSTAT